MTPTVGGKSSRSRTLTQQELCAKAKARFGDDPRIWAFTCPNCSDVACAAHFIAIDADPQRVGQECIGRSLGALAHAATGTDGLRHAERGCDWAAYGLFSGPWLIEMPDGQGGTKKAPGFPLATTDEANRASVFCAQQDNPRHNPATCPTNHDESGKDAE